MARTQSRSGSEPTTTSLLTPSDDKSWGVLTEKQREAVTLRSILDDFIRDDGWKSEPQQRRAFHAWLALTRRADW